MEADEGKHANGGNERVLHEKGARRREPGQAEPHRRTPEARAEVRGTEHGPPEGNEAHRNDEQSGDEERLEQAWMPCQTSSKVAWACGVAPEAW